MIGYWGGGTDEREGEVVNKILDVPHRGKKKFLHENKKGNKAKYLKSFTINAIHMTTIRSYH